MGAVGRRTVGAGGRKEAERTVSSANMDDEERGVGTAEIASVLERARDGTSEGSYTEKVLHGKGAVKSVRAGVRVGEGLGLYHRFAQGEVVDGLMRRTTGRIFS